MVDALGSIEGLQSLKWVIQQAVISLAIGAGIPLGSLDIEGGRFMVSLLEVVSSEAIESKTVAQIIAFSGNGNLKDGNQTSSEFRQLLANLPPSKLTNYVNECLTSPFDQSPQALQDVVNEIGRRIGFSVEPGLYRGKKTEIGFDGIWRTEDGYGFVIEVKTTTAYQIDLNVHATYRSKLIGENRLSKDKSSILIVVGRNDTGGLESQTRGSRHAWDIRIISTDALIKLMNLKLEITEETTLKKIQNVLKPLEYTRVDTLIDFIFTTTSDLKMAVDTTETQELQAVMTTDVADQVTSPANYQENCIALIQKKLGLPLIKQGRVKFSNDDQSTRVICVVSKEYQRLGVSRYWYAFHPAQQKYLAAGTTSFVALGCGSADNIILIPIAKFFQLLPKMRTTQNTERTYWHVEIFKDGDIFKLLSPGADGVDVSNYKI